MKRETLETLLADRAAKRPVVVATNTETGAQALIYPNTMSGELELDEAALAKAREALRDDASASVETASGPLFLQVFNPPARLILIGAVHIAQPLARMGALAGYDVTIVDPRASFATAERFPGVTLNDEWPDEALDALKPDRRTAVVTLTHDPKLDDPALDVALRSDAFYIGSLGSRKTHAARLERLAERGFDKAASGRIHGPVGLALGARAPAEIAVSILAQITQVLHGKEAP